MAVLQDEAVNVLNAGKDVTLTCSKSHQCTDNFEFFTRVRGSDWSRSGVDHDRRRLLGASERRSVESFAWSALQPQSHWTWRMAVF